jgi:O-antigen ligase/Tfp pilus assembly protein PilF
MTNMNLPYKKILFYLTLAALFTPFLVSSYTYFPFTVTKATVFRLVVELMLVIWVFWLIKEKKTLPKLTPSTKAVLIYGLIILISALLGVNFKWSFFSGNERMEGVFGIWHFILFFIILATTFDWKEIERILKIQVFISLFYSFIALLAYFNVGQITSKMTSNRLAGYTGNPSFFATYLLFNAFFALYFYFQEYLLDKKLYNHWFLAFILQSLLMFTTGTRGAMIGYFVAILGIFLGIIFLDKDQEHRSFKKLILIIFLLGIIIIASSFVFKNNPLVNNNFALNRLTSISLKDPTAASRILSAGIAWKSFLEKPLLGWGPENYETAYIKNFNPKIVKYLPEDFYFDRVHNKPMEVLATTGIFGLVSYFAIFVCAFWLLFKNQKKNREWLLPSLALSGVVIGYFIQNVFIFDFHESYLMFFLILAFVNSLHNPQKLEDSRNLRKIPRFLSIFLQYFVLVIISGLVIYSSIFGVIKPYLTSRNIFYTNYYMRQGQGKEALSLLQRNTKTADFFAGDIVAGFREGFLGSLSNLTDSDKAKLIGEIVNFIDRVKTNKFWFYQASLAKVDLEAIASQWDTSKMTVAEQDAEEILATTPFFPTSHLLAAKIYYLNNNIDKAIEESQKTIELNPQMATSYYILYLSYGRLNNIEESNKNLIKAARLHYVFSDKQIILKAINLLVQEKDYSTIAELYLSAIQLEPNDVSLYVFLAATYGKLRNKEKAIEYAQKAVELNPTLKQAGEDFIQLIKNEEWDKIQD